MKNSTLLKIVNPVLFAAVLLQFVNVILQKTVPVGWVSEMHELLGFAIGILVVIHLILNWGWVKNNLFRKKPAK